MLWHSLGMAVWFSVVVGLTGALGRILKALWSSMPAWLLPMVALGGGYLILFGDLALHEPTPLADDARLALWGVLLGGAAVGGHELAKKLLVSGLALAGMDSAKADRVAEIILGKLGTKVAKPPLVTMIVVALFLGGCANPMGTAVLASNAAAHTLGVTHEQLTAQRKADQLEAARAVDGPRGDPTVVAAQLRAAQEVGVRYRPAWQAYSVARFAWLRLVSALKLLEEHPELLDPGSLVGLVRALIDAQAELEAYARDAMRGVKALRADAPPPALLEVSP